MAGAQSGSGHSPRLPNLAATRSGSEVFKSSDRRTSMSMRSRSAPNAWWIIPLSDLGELTSQGVTNAARTMKNDTSNPQFQDWPPKTVFLAARGAGHDSSRNVEMASLPMTGFVLNFVYTPPHG